MVFHIPTNLVLEFRISLGEPIFKEVLMSKVSSKRQVTLPIDLCLLAGIEPGDEVSIFVDRRGAISVVKKNVGSSRGLLKDARKLNNMSDENSLASVMHHPTR